MSNPFQLVSDGAVTKVVGEDGAPWSACAVWEALAKDATFRERFAAELASSPFEAFFWETPPLHDGALDRPYEHVLLDARRLAFVEPDPSSFEEHFDARSDVAVFPSLRGDATLIAPCPRGPEHAYGHFAAFLRGAPPTQVHALLAAVGREVLAHVGPEPRWVSTSGLGVPWLHVRLDSVPKYYHHAPYADER
jgi:hypothetical protein